MCSCSPPSSLSFPTWDKELHLFSCVVLRSQSTAHLQMICLPWLSVNKSNRWSGPFYLLKYIIDLCYIHVIQPSCLNVYSYLQCSCCHWFTSSVIRLKSYLTDPCNRHNATVLVMRKLLYLISYQAWWIYIYIKNN